MPSSLARGSKAGRVPERSTLLQPQLTGAGPFKIGQGTLQVAVGNLAECGAEGLVCYASSSLALHSVVASRLVEAGGSSIRSECAKHVPTDIGTAIVLSAGKLPARYILVAVTNHIKSAPTMASIRASVQAVLTRADQLGLHSIAIPTIRVSKQMSPDDTLLATLAPIVDYLSGHSSIARVLLVIDDADDFPQLPHYFPLCLERLRPVGSLRAIAHALGDVETALRRSERFARAASPPLVDSLAQVVRQQLDLQQQVLELLEAQYDELGQRWHSSHRVEVELTEQEISRLADLLEQVPALANAVASD